MNKEQQEMEDWDKAIRISTGKNSSEIPPPTNYEEFEKQLKVFGQRVCESLQWRLSTKYPSGNERIIEEELKDIYQFIELAKKLMVHNTCSNDGTIWNAPVDQIEYSRLLNDYYKKNFASAVLSECSATALVYGRYFLFKDWLEEQLPKEEKTGDEGNPKNPENLTLRQIAMIHYYQGKVINPNNNNEIAMEYGFISGHSLYQKYNDWSKISNRTGQGTERENRAKKENFELVIEKLEGTAKERAIKEFETFKAGLPSD